MHISHASYLFCIKMYEIILVSHNRQAMFVDHEDWEGNLIDGTRKAENTGQPSLQVL